MQKKNSGLNSKSFKLIVALSLFLLTIVSLTSCSSGKVAASLKEDGSFEYEGQKYIKVNDDDFSVLIYDTDKNLGKLEGIENTNIYTLRYAKDETFLCTQNYGKEKVLYIAEGKNFVSGGKRTSDVLMKYKNEFIKNVEDNNDFNKILRLDMIKGENTKVSIDIKNDNWVSIYSCYDSSPVANIWFGTLLKKEDKIYFILPEEGNKGITGVFNSAENAEEVQKIEYSCRYFENIESIEEALRITGLS